MVIMITKSSLISNKLEFKAKNPGSNLCRDMLFPLSCNTFKIVCVQNNKGLETCYIALE